MVELVIKYIDTQVGGKKRQLLTPGERIICKRHHKTVQSTAVNGIYTVMIMQTLNIVFIKVNIKLHWELM